VHRSIFYIFYQNEDSEMDGPVIIIKGKLHRTVILIPGGKRTLWEMLSCKRNINYSLNS
jgi:hypothetical protein